MFPLSRGEQKACWTLHFTVAGQCLVVSESGEWEVNEGDLMLFPPKARYRYGIHPAAGEWEHFWVLFIPRSHWNPWLNWGGGHDGIQQLRAAGQRAQTQAAIDKLLSLKDEAPAYMKELQYNTLEELLIRLAGQREAQSVSRDHRIDQACQFMENHLGQPFRIEDVAGACSLSPSRLSHLFKEHMGLSMKAWINAQRLQEARRRLIYSDDNISQIAFAVGFEDANLFAKNFRKNMGCSPSEFRQSFTAR